jgi:carboxypeptidase family protein/TonB-dependent receptor-like protein
MTTTSTASHSRLGIALLCCIAGMTRLGEAQVPRGYVALDTLAPPASLRTLIALPARQGTVGETISFIGARAGITFVYDASLPGLERRVRPDTTVAPAATALVRTLATTDLRAFVSNEGTVILASVAKPRPRTSTITGVVRDSTGPIAGVHVSLTGTRAAALTDERGRFRLAGLQAATYALSVRRLGYAAETRAVVVDTASTHVDLPDVVLSAAPVPIAAVVVTPGYYGILTAGLASQRALTRVDIETVPQLGEDVYRTMARLPGVAMDDFSARFAIRGVFAEQLYVTLDGLPMTEPFHLRDMGSTLSIVDLAALEQAELIAGGVSAEYGNEIGGVLQMHTVDPRANARVGVGLSLTNVRGIAQGEFATGKGAWLVSARRGFFDLVFKLAKIEDSLSPSYHDVFAKATYDIPGGRLGLHVLHAGDRIRYDGPNDPSLQGHYSSDNLWVTADETLGGAVQHHGVVWVSPFQQKRYGQEAGANEPTVRIRDERARSTVGLRDDWTITVRKSIAVKVGAELRREQARYDYSRYFAQPIVVDGHLEQSIDSSATAFRFASTSSGGYGSLRVQPVSSLTAELGARYDAATDRGSTGFAPRLNGAWQATSRTTVRAAWGIHAQLQPLSALQVEEGVHDFQRPERATQIGVGIDQLLMKSTTAHIEWYARERNPVWSRFVNASARIYPFTEIFPELVYVAPTRARERGIELELERRVGRHVDWSASYVRSSATQEVNGKWVAQAGDQRNAFRADVAVHPADARWRLTVSAMAHTGWPYTPQLVRVDTITANGAQSVRISQIPGPLYSERATTYKRVDARWTKFIGAASGSRSSIFVDVYNLFGTLNERERVYVVSVNQLRTTMRQRSRLSLPRIPSVGFNWEF